MSNATTLADLRKIVKGLGRTSEALQRAVVAAANKLDAMTKEKISAEQNPWGRAWKALSPETIRQKRSSAILRDTGALLSSVSVEAQGLTIRVAADVPYARYPLRGTSRMKARAILPRKAVPKPWTEAIANEVKANVEGALK